MDILFVANSYLTYCYANHLDTLMSKAVDRVFVLFENSSGISNLYGSEKQYEIRVVRDVQDIIDRIDLIILLQDQYFPQNGVERLQKLADSHLVELLRVDITRCCKYDYQYCDSYFTVQSRKPILYLLGEGMYSCLQKAEMIISQILKNKQIHSSFFFSPVTREIIFALNEIGYANDFFKLLPCDESELTLISVCNSFFIHSINSLSIQKMFINNKPDFAVLFLPNRATSYDKESIKNIFQNKFNVELYNVLVGSFREIPPGASRADAFFVSDSDVTGNCFSSFLIDTLEEFIYQKTIPNAFHIINCVDDERKNSIQEGENKNVIYQR